MAEMVRHDVDGLLFSPGDASALAAQLRRLIDEPRLLERLRRGIRVPISIEEDAARVRRTYADVVARSGDRPPSALTVKRAPTAAATPSLAAVVLNYRTADQTTLAVRSLQSAFDPPAAIFVVDNGSGDGSCEALRASLGGVEIIDAGGNLGFSGGCNIGARAALEAGAEYVLFMNSDAVAAPEAIGCLVDVLRHDAAAGIVGPVLLGREEPDRIASAGISFSTRTGRMRHRAAGLPVSLLPPVRAYPVDAVSGCTMLVRREVFERAGFFDEAYFFSFEDVDFCLRARSAGFLTACVQDAIVYHEGGRSIGRRSAARVYYATRNHLRLTSEAGSSLGREWRRAVVVGLNVAYVLVAPEAPLLAGLAAVARGTWHHFRGRYGPS
jgi:GT2 family glycosyltransferase